MSGADDETTRMPPPTPARAARRPQPRLAPP